MCVSAPLNWGLFLIEFMERLYYNLDKVFTCTWPGYFVSCWKNVNIYEKIHIAEDLYTYYSTVLRKDILISKTWVVSLLITEGSSPSSFTLTGKAWLAGSMACSMHTNFLMTRLTSWQNSHLQWHISEVLEFTVDIQITDATMEAGAILSWRLA